MTQSLKSDILQQWLLKCFVNLCKKLSYIGRKSFKMMNICLPGCVCVCERERERVCVQTNNISSTVPPYWPRAPYSCTQFRDVYSKQSLHSIWWTL